MLKAAVGALESREGEAKAAARWVPERQACKLQYRVTGTATVLDIVSEMRLEQKRGELCLTDWRICCGDSRRS